MRPARIRAKKMTKIIRFCILASVTIAMFSFNSCKKDKEDPTVTSIDVTTQPTKKEYLVGESFDPAGMVVTATYSDNSTASVNITENMLEYDFSTAGVNKSVTITYESNTVTGVTVKKHRKKIHKYFCFFYVNGLPNFTKEVISKKHPINFL